MLFWVKLSCYAILVCWFFVVVSNETIKGSTSPSVKIMTTTATKTQIDNLIVIAEKSQTYGTQRVFSDLFGIRFSSGRYLYTRRIRKQRVAILYLDLSEMRVNGAYAEWCCNEQLRAYRNLVRVICFEFCNPRMQEVENNIRQLRSLVDIDSVVFLFFLDSSITNTSESERKLGILKQMNEFYECKYLDNLSERVFLLDQRRRLRLDSILPTWFAREEPSTSTQPLTTTSTKVAREPERIRDLVRKRELKREREREQVRKNYSSDKTLCALVFLALCFFFFICILVIVLFLYNKAHPLKV